jgi:sigma-B regulation protein RsbU (phosphoserine phosphatase)
MTSDESTDLPAERLSLVYELSQTFNSSLDLEDLLNTLIDEVINATGAERGFVVLREADDSFEFRAARGMEHETIGDPDLEISRGVVQSVMDGGVGLLTSDAQQDDRFKGRQSVMSLGLRSILCSPLTVKDDTVGAIYVDNRLHAGIFTQEDLEMLNAIASSAAIAIENARLYGESVEMGRMERELSMARRVQTGLIAEEIPEIEGWQFAARWIPAREVAGDFYDFVTLDAGRMGLVIADVTDKGMGAALFMVVTRSMLIASLEGSIFPAEAITKANRLMCRYSTSPLPVTLFYARVSPDNNELIYVNAGHNPPYVHRTETGNLDPLDRTGMVLGLDDSLELQQASVQLESGDVIVMYTDGVPDALNEAEEAYGENRLRSKIRDHEKGTAEEMAAALQKSLVEFIGDAEPFDDITLLVAKRE